MDDIFLKYGLPGAIIFALSTFVYKLIDWHRKDRAEWHEQYDKQVEESRKLQEQQFDRLGELTDESNKVLRDHTNVLSGLKSLLENQNRK